MSEETVVVKRGRGRPRKAGFSDEVKVKRPRGRPRKERAPEAVEIEDKSLPVPVREAMVAQTFKVVKRCPNPRLVFGVMDGGGGVMEPIWVGNAVHLQPGMMIRAVMDAGRGMWGIAQELPRWAGDRRFEVR